MKEIQDIRDKFEKDITKNNISPFTKDGFEKYKVELSEYIQTLFEESLRVSKRSKADNISAIHVENANNHLISKSRSKLLALLNTLGGIMIGNGISTVISINAFNLSYSNSGITITIIIAVIGAFLMGFSFFSR